MEVRCSSLEVSVVVTVSVPTSISVVVSLPVSISVLVLTPVSVIDSVSIADSVSVADQVSVSLVSVTVGSSLVDKGVELASAELVGSSRAVVAGRGICVGQNLKLGLPPGL